jgi:hypothetical protein
LLKNSKVFLQLLLYLIILQGAWHRTLLLQRVLYIASVQGPPR